LIIVVLCLNLGITACFAYDVVRAASGMQTEVYYVKASSSSDFKSAVSAAATTWNAERPENILQYAGLSYAGNIENYYNNDLRFFSYDDYGISPYVRGLAHFTAVAGEWYWYIQINYDNTYFGFVPTTFDPQGVITHEFGHVVGLGDVSDKNALCQVL